MFVTASVRGFRVFSGPIQNTLVIIWHLRLCWQSITPQIAARKLRTQQHRAHLVSGFFQDRVTKCTHLRRGQPGCRCNTSTAESTEAPSGMSRTRGVGFERPPGRCCGTLCVDLVSWKKHRSKKTKFHVLLQYYSSIRYTCHNIRKHFNLFFMFYYQYYDPNPTARLRCCPRLLLPTLRMRFVFPAAVPFRTLPPRHGLHFANPPSSGAV